MSAVVMLFKSFLQTLIHISICCNMWLNDCKIIHASSVKKIQKENFYNIKGHLFQLKMPLSYNTVHQLFAWVSLRMNQAIIITSHFTWVQPPPPSPFPVRTVCDARIPMSINHIYTHEVCTLCAEYVTVYFDVVIFDTFSVLCIYIYL